jgi:3-methyladenine DNA glycosylase AlkD
MKLKQAMKELEALGNEKMRTQNTNHGSGDNQFGVRRGEVRKLAKAIKTNHELALELWATGNIDARFLATLIIKPKSLSADELDDMVRSLTFTEVADWLNNYVVKKHADKESLRQAWMETDDLWAARSGWTLTAERVHKSPEGLDLSGLLDRIEAELVDAAPEPQWTMNICLANIGIYHPKLRKRALAIGNALGVYGDWPEVKGCTSPFAPIWIDAMVKRQG